MTDFEKIFREGLAEAAQRAPTFDLTSLSPPDSAPQRPRRWHWPVALVAVGLIGVGIWVIAPDSHQPPPQAVCAAALRLEGQKFNLHGEGLLVPRPGARIGEGTVPGCDDGHGATDPKTLTVYEVPGLDPTIAVFADNHLWLAADLATAPEAVQAMDRPLGCSGNQRMTVRGHVTAINLAGAGGAEIRAPYTLTFVAVVGEGLPLDRFSQVTLRLKITPTTQNGQNADLVDSALQEGVPVTAVVVCEGQEFEALSLTLTE